MGSFYPRASAIVLLVMLAVQPALNAWCLAACEPTQADTSTSSHHETSTACHDDGPGMRVSASDMSACGDHDRTTDDRTPTLTAGRDGVTDLLAAAGSLSTPLQPGSPDLANPISASSASAPSLTRSAIRVVLRI